MEHEICRVVSLQPSATVILERLGMLDRVVACTRHCLNLCPAAKGRTIVEDSWTAQSEQVRDARPDLVIASVPYQFEAVAEILRAGVRVLALAPRKLADVYADVSVIANLFGQAERGRDLIAEMRGVIAEVRAVTANSARPLVYCEEWGKPMLCSQAWVAELVEAAGGSSSGSPQPARLLTKLRRLIRTSSWLHGAAPAIEFRSKRSFRPAGGPDCELCGNAAFTACPMNG